MQNNSQAYSRPLFGAIIAPNLVPWVLKKIFSLEMGKNDIYLWGCKQTKGSFFRKFALKNAPMPLMSKIGRDKGK